MYLTVQGLVLRSTDYGERDILLTILTRDHGRLTVKARNLRRKNNPLAAACQILTYSEFTLFVYRNKYTVNEGHPLELFADLKRDLNRLALGSYFSQVTDLVAQEDMPNPQLLSLSLNCLYALSKLQLSEFLVKAVFELRIACISGYTPDLSGCHNCGNSLPDRLDISAGRLECAGCRDYGSDGLRMPISPAMLEAMRYIVSCPDKRLFSFSVGEETTAQLSQLSESYLTAQLERSFSTLDFYKSLLI